MKRLAVSLAIRVALPAAALALAPNLVGDAGARALGMLPDPHGALKWGLESSQGLLLRQREIPAVMLLSAAAVVTLSALPTRWWGPGVLVVTLGALAAPRMATWPLLVLLALLIVNGLPASALADRKVRRLAFVPGSLLLAPAIVASALGLRPLLRRVLLGGAGAALGFGWVWADCLASYDAVRAGLEAWPAALLDPRITVMAQSPAGVRADWHSVQIVGDHAIVVGETRPRLLAFPLDGGPPIERPLGPRWGSERAAALDTETDAATGLTWVLGGPRTLLELRWKDGRWEDVRAVPLPAGVGYAYLVRTDADRLLIAGIQASGDNHAQVMSVQLPDLSDLRGSAFGRDGLRSPRQVAWIPTLDRLAMAPEFGEGLHLADVATGETALWIRTPTIDGKMVWIPGLERLLVALPNRLEMWVVDPATGEVDWTIPTQPGVRSLAVDEARGLVVSASVLTGRILVQDLRTGAVRASLGTVMPMVRELALAKDRGVAVLTTWAAVYRFPYADP